MLGFVLGHKLRRSRITCEDFGFLMVSHGPVFGRRRGVFGLKSLQLLLLLRS